uniref:Saposin B-type domain-containing protein n=1 Tax=Hemiselmis andersenii TaxID=464988 RepID=A0A6U2DX59_HEMAN|mmetsp:Transcript_26257/g.60864  ORF Transcript_26257/g.60864 Transcript_26257/m.60864 type:complete len:334 (+) Transcript_26257:35-1036(+)
MGRFHVVLLAACICVALSPPVWAKKGGGKARKEVDEASDGCRACKRVVMSLDRTVLPKFEQIFKGKKGSKMYMGSLSIYMQEELANICTFDIIHYQKNLRKECESMLDDHEDDMLVVLTAHARESMGEEKFLKGMCVEAAKRCPKHVNSTASEAPKSKRELKTQRPPKETDQGPLRRIVAETWVDEVMGHDRDVVTLMYSTQDDKTKNVIEALKGAADLLLQCSTVRFGIVNLQLNELPPPHGNYVEGVDGIAMWKGSEDASTEDKIPVFWKRDWREDGASAFDILDFVFRSVGRKDSHACIHKVSNEQDEESLRELQQPGVWKGEDNPQEEL